MADTKTQEPKTTNELDELEVTQVVKKPTTKKTPVKAEVKAAVKQEVKVAEKTEEKPAEKVVEAKPVKVVKEVKAVKTVETTEASAKKSTGTKKAALKTDELLQKHTQMLQFTQNLLSEMEMNIKRCKLVIKQLTNFDPANPDSLNVADKAIQESVGKQSVALQDDDGGEVVEGKFDGYFMVGNDQKKYPVPLNYSSKTKMVPGDQLKLKIMDDGKFIYKLIQPAERKHIRAILSKTDENKYIAMTDEGKMFFLNQAAVTFHKGRPGDELYIVTNKDESGGFATIEAVIKK